MVLCKRGKMRKFINEIPPVFLSFIVPYYSSADWRNYARHSLVCGTFLNRWSSLLNFKHSATGSSGEIQKAPDGLTAMFENKWKIIRPGSIRQTILSFYARVPRLSQELRSFLLFVACSREEKMLSMVIKTCCSSFNSYKAVFWLLLRPFDANFLHFLTEFVWAKECWFPSSPRQLFKK